jgi:hypothetical protein
MKNCIAGLFLTTVFHLCSGSLAWAQSFGFKAGANLNSVRIEPSGKFLGKEPEARLGYHLGILMNVNLSRRIAIAPEMQFIKRGYDIVPPYSGEEVHYTFNYIELPVMFSFVPIEKLALEVGPNFGYLISARLSSERDFKADDLFDKKFDFGIKAGLRVGITENIFTGLRYYYGITAVMDKVIRDETNYPLGEYQEYNRSLELSLGYLIK